MDIADDTPRILQKHFITTSRGRPRREFKMFVWFSHEECREAHSKLRRPFTSSIREFPSLDASIAMVVIGDVLESRSDVQGIDTIVSIIGKTISDFDKGDGAHFDEMLTTDFSSRSFHFAPMKVDRDKLPQTDCRRSQFQASCLPWSRLHLFIHLWLASIYELIRQRS